MSGVGNEDSVGATGSPHHRARKHGQYTQARLVTRHGSMTVHTGTSLAMLLFSVLHAFPYCSPRVEKSKPGDFHRGVVGSIFFI